MVVVGAPGAGARPQVGEARREEVGRVRRVVRPAPGVVVAVVVVVVVVRVPQRAVRRQVPVAGDADVTCPQLEKLDSPLEIDTLYSRY